MPETNHNEKATYQRKGGRQTSKGGRQTSEKVDVGPIFAEIPSEILLQLAETTGDPMALLVSWAHLSKAFCEAARNAQGLFKHAELRLRADDAAVASVVSKCPQLSSLDLRYCRTITDVALRAVASSCPQLSSLSLG